MPLAAVIPAVVAGVGGAGAAATLGSAALGAGAAIYSSSQAKKANNKALDAQTIANDKALEEQRAAREQVTALQQPFVQGGYSALDAVMNKYGLGKPSAAPGAAPQVGGSVPNYGTPQGGAPAPQPAPQPAPATPQIDVAAYLKANPDIATYYAQTPDAQKLSLEDFAKDVAVQQADVRGAPPMLPQQAAPQGPAPYVPEYIRPEQPEWQGSGAAPSEADYLDPSKFKESEGYQFRLNEGMRNLNAKFGARGLLKSGGAIKGATDYGQGAASAEYGNWFNRQKSLYDTALNQYNANRSAEYNIFSGERNNSNQNFADDRSYGTNLGVLNRNFDANRDDTTTNNLFKLIGTGTEAAGATGDAASNYAANADSIYGYQADAAGNAAYGNGAANAQLAGSLAGIGANLFSGAPRVSPAAANTNTSGQVNLGSLNYGNIFGPTPYIRAF